MILIDADVLVYRVGFGCKDYELLPTLDTLQSIVKDILSNFEPQDSHLIISNSDKTFRHDIAVTAPYKGNRKADKPQFYQELRDYIIEDMDGTMSRPGLEADDEIGITVDRKKDIIVTTDKDLMMIPALAHYNFVKDELVKVKRPAYYFWVQMLQGDRADNIVGLTGIGEKKAQYLLEGAKTKDMRKIVEEEYKREFGENWFLRFNENGRLLWIKRHIDKEYFDYV